MSAHFTVIQYVPDPVTGERVNIGIAAFACGAVTMRFLTNWQRVRSLWGRDALDPDRLETLFQGIDEERLNYMIKTWSNAIQFTPPCGSLRSLEETADEAARRFLVEPPPSERGYRLHGDVVVFARHTLLAVITQRLGTRAAKKCVRRRMEFPGRLGINRRFDLGVRNGQLLHAIQAISFAGTKSVDRSVEAAAFLAEEIGGKYPLTVVVAPPPAPGRLYEDARKTLTSFGATFVEEDEFVPVAREIAEAVVKSDVGKGHITHSFSTSLWQVPDDLDPTPPKALDSPSAQGEES